MMNYRNVILLSVIILLSTSLISQERTINIDNTCFVNNNYKNNSVESFKDQLTLTLDIVEITDGRISSNVDISFKEQIENESLVQINESVALKISIVRAIDFGVKKYLYKFELFRRRGECWASAGGNGLWNEFYPGIITNGFAVGIENTAGYLGFNGSVMIE